MIITVDIGNTNIKIGLFEGDNLKHSFKMTSDVDRTSDEYLALLTQLLGYWGVDTHSIGGGIISSVIPQLDYTFSHVLNYAFGFEPMVVGVGVKTGLDIRYDNPRELGTDRIITCVGALQKYPVPFVLIDFGTATTYNVVNSNRQYLGGAITVGIRTSAVALANAASKLHQVDLDIPHNIIATNTTSAIQSGILYGAVGQVKYMVDNIKSQCGYDQLTVIATGGLSQLVYDIEPVFHHIDKSLSLYGLYHIYCINNK